MSYLGYQTAVADDMPSARRIERSIFDRAIRLMANAEDSGMQPARVQEALLFIRQFWRVLIEDLAHDENGLPDALRASLISIGLWNLREAMEIESGRGSGFQDMMDINAMIRDGLS